MSHSLLSWRLLSFLIQELLGLWKHVGKQAQRSNQGICRARIIILGLCVTLMWNNKIKESKQEWILIISIFIPLVHLLCVSHLSSFQQGTPPTFLSLFSMCSNEFNKSCLHECRYLWGYSLDYRRLINSTTLKKMTAQPPSVKLSIGLHRRLGPHEALPYPSIMKCGPVLCKSYTIDNHHCTEFTSEWPHYVQKMPFCWTSSQSLTLPFFLLPLAWCSLSLGSRWWIEVSSRVKHHSFSIELFF